MAAVHDHPRISKPQPEALCPKSELQSPKYLHEALNGTAEVPNENWCSGFGLVGVGG